jgi:hypothetical protein
MKSTPNWVIKVMALGAVLGLMAALSPKLHALINELHIFELRPCSRTLGYFTPVHERVTKWDNIEERTPTILRQARLIGFMNQERRRAA